MADIRLVHNGERAAFRGRPGDGIVPLRRFLIDAPPGSPDQLRATWLLGVCLGAAGKFGSAAATLRPLLALPSHPPTETRYFAGQAACALASLHRQVGRFEQARDFDAWAARVAPADPAVAVTAEVGLTADSVGQGQLDEAREHLDRARDLCGAEPQWWRERVRIGWVAAEVALASNEPQAAIAAVAESVEQAEHVGAPRHVAKSLLFLGAAQDAIGDATSRPTVGRAALLAESLGAMPLVWASRGLLWRWLAADNPTEAEANRAAAERAVRSMVADMPAELAAEWLARADVAPLLRAEAQR